jgi:hypothetical protein
MKALTLVFVFLILPSISFAEDVYEELERLRSSPFAWVDVEEEIVFIGELVNYAMEEVAVNDVSDLVKQSKNTISICSWIHGIGRVGDIDVLSPNVYYEDDSGDVISAYVPGSSWILPGRLMLIVARKTSYANPQATASQNQYFCPRKIYYLESGCDDMAQIIYRLTGAVDRSQSYKASSLDVALSNVDIQIIPTEHTVQDLIDELHTRVGNE